LEPLEARATPTVSVAQQFSANEYTALSISHSQLLAGDSGSGTLTVSNPTQPANATLADNHNGTFTFTPTIGFTGTTAFQYTVSSPAQAQLVPINAGAGDGFGNAVAIDGQTVVVGADHENGGAGAVYVFVLSGNAWVQQAVLTASDTTPSAAFGTSLAISGDTVVVGAPGQLVNSSDAPGAAYVFTRSGSSWSQQAELGVPSAPMLGIFGEQVAVSSNTAIVLANPQTSNFNASGFGAAFVFVQSGSSWTQQAELASGAFNQSSPGSVAIEGDTALIGAPFHNPNAGPSAGTVFVYERSGNTWDQQAALTAQFGFSLGSSVALSGDIAIIGADADGYDFNGGAYAFVRSGTTWTQESGFGPPQLPTGEAFGSSVAAEGGTAVIGASLVGSDPYVYIFSGGNWIQESGPTSQSLSTAVEGVGISDGNIVWSQSTVVSGHRTQGPVVVQYAMSATATATVQVNPATTQLLVTPTATPISSVEGQPYSGAAFAASGGAGAGYTFQQSGKLPPGLTFDAVHGRLVGTPAQVGSYPGIIIAASDGKGGSGSQTYTLIVDHYGENGFPLAYPLAIYTPPTSKSDSTANINAFVTGLYHSILDRNPESASTSLPFWEGVFNAVQSGAGNFLNLTGVLPINNSPYAYVADAIWQSPEHRWDEIDTYYRDFLGRSIDPGSVANYSERQYWANQFLFNGATEEQVIRGFLSSPEYLYDHRNDASLTQSLITSLLASGASTADDQAWSSALSTLNAQRAAIQNQAFPSAEAYQAALAPNLGALDNEATGTGVLFGMLGSNEYRQAAMTAFYQAFLRRGGTAAELRTWLTALGTTNQALNLGTIAASILGSQEYQTNAVNSEV
jgi:hypothetical protein